MVDDEPASETTFLYELARDFETQSLVSYLRHSDSPEVRRRTAEILGDFATVSSYTDQEEAIRALIRTVREDDDDGVRARAIDSLYQYGRDALDRLIGKMADIDVEDSPDWVTSRTLVGWLDAEHSEFRMVAAGALGRLGDERAVDRLTDALSDPAPRVRARAARSCGQIGDPRCIEPLADRLNDRRPLVRRAAANALGAIGTREALEALVPLARDDDEELRRIAIDELGQFGSLDPVIVLLRALDDESQSVQRTAIISLIQLFVDAPPEQTESVRESVAQQLRNSDTTAVVPPLLDVMAESQRWAIRRNAVWLLGSIADGDDQYRDEVYDRLIDALDDQDDETAELATESLIQLESDELERRLHIYIQDEPGSEAAVERARTVLEETDRALSQELVTNSVEYKYIRDPADYTAQQRDDEQ